MNELCNLFSQVHSGESVVLEQNKIYHVRQDDSFDLNGFFCSNTTKQCENPDGHRFSAIYLQNRKDIVIDGNGASLIVHGKMTPMLLDHCENITVKNLTIDYACPTMTEFTVLDNNDGIITIRINPDCLFRVDGNKLYWHGELGSNGKPYWEDLCCKDFTQGGHRYAKTFDPETQITKHFNTAQLTFTKIEQLDAHTLRCTLTDRNIKLPAGTVIQTRNIIRDQVGGMFQRCKNLRLENLRVKFMHGLGMIAQFCENMTYKNCDFTPKNGRTIASTADFFHFSGCRGQLVIDGCKARGAQDDFVNVHGTYLQIADVNPDSRTITVRFCNPESWGFQAFAEGDILEFVKWDTLISYGNTRVLRFEKLNPTDILLHVSQIPNDIAIGKDVVENTTWTPDVHILNCDFGPSNGRGILCTTRGKVMIENNRFEKLIGTALLVSGDCNFWFESGHVQEIVFRNNEVISCNYGITHETAPIIQCMPEVTNENSCAFVHGKLVLTGNRFLKPLYGSHSIWLEYLREAVITDNCFDAAYEIHSKVCGNIVDENNLRL